MPLYQYKCEKCEHEWEDIIPFSDADNQYCEKCNGKGIRQIVSSSFILKGDGWLGQAQKIIEHGE